MDDFRIPRWFSRLALAGGVLLVLMMALAVVDMVGRFGPRHHPQPLDRRSAVERAERAYGAGMPSHVRARLVTQGTGRVWRVYLIGGNVCAEVADGRSPCSNSVVVTVGQRTGAVIDTQADPLIPPA